MRGAAGVRGPGGVGCSGPQVRGRRGVHGGSGDAWRKLYRGRRALGRARDAHAGEQARAGEQLTASSRRREGARAPPASGRSPHPHRLRCPVLREASWEEALSTCVLPQVTDFAPLLWLGCVRIGAQMALAFLVANPCKGIAAIWEGESAINILDLARGK